MSQFQNQESKRKVRLGRKEKEIIEFLKQHGGSIWKEEIIKEFVYASKYTRYFVKKLYRLQEKGLIEIRLEQNPATGRLKQKVYLKQ